VTLRFVKVETTAPRSRQKANAALRVRDLLRSLILSGHFSAGDGSLPSETTLMFEYGVSRNVVREALGLLRDEGLVKRLQGAGTFVVLSKIRHQFGHTHGIADEPEQRGARRRGRIRSFEVVTAPSSVAAKLDLVPGDDCTLIESAVSIGAEPFSITTSYVTADLADQLRSQPFDGDFYEFLEGVGCELGPTELSVEAVVADDLVADELEISCGAPVFLMERRIVLNGGQPVEYGFVRCRGDHLVLNTVLPRHLADGRSRTEQS